MIKPPPCVICSADSVMQLRDYRWTGFVKEGDTTRATLEPTGDCIQLCKEHRREAVCVNQKEFDEAAAAMVANIE